MFRSMLFCLAVCVLMDCTTKVVQPAATTTDSSILTDTLPEGFQAKPLFTIPVQSKYFTTDKLNQIYLVTERNEVIKYTAQGKEIFRYNNNFLENLSHVDVTDPFNVLLYYPDYLSVITLDRTMTKTGEFDLNSLDLFQVKAVGTSNDNNVWIYDEIAFQLKKIDRNGAVLRKSVNLNLQLNYSPDPVFLMERENVIYLNDPKLGIFVFNAFGQYESILEMKGIERFQVFDNQLFYKKGRDLFSYHLQSLSQKKIILPIQLEEEENVQIQKNRLIVQKKGGVEVYKL